MFKIAYCSNVHAGSNLGETRRNLQTYACRVRSLYSPGSHIPIVIEDELEQQPDINYVLAWNFKQEILANNQHLIDSGVEFYFPVDLEIEADTCES